MSYTTAADEARDRALEHIGEAIKEIGSIVVGGISGAEDFNKEYRGKLMASLWSLMQVKEDL